MMMIIMALPYYMLQSFMHLPARFGPYHTDLYHTQKDRIYKYNVPQGQEGLRTQNPLVAHLPFVATLPKVFLEI